MGKKVIILGVDMNSFVHIHNREKNVLILGKVPMRGLHDITLTVEAKYLVKFSR